MTHKRKHGDTFSMHEKLVHKSCLLLKREVKKVRAFMLRKVVQQLKQLRLQLEEHVQDLTKQHQREQKLRHSIEKLEKEYKILKELVLDKVVARSKLQTGLDKLQTDREIPNEHEEIQEWSEREDSENEANDTKEDEKERVKQCVKKEAASIEHHSTEVKKMGEQETELETKLIDRVLAHKRIVPVLEAIKKLVDKEEKEAEKKRRAQEKRMLKRGRHEALVGNTGRSGVAPTSLFLGSLSGRGKATIDLDMGTDDTYGTMAGADDDIAEFLGEKKKKKNRSGQIARRMKALRQEEASRRKENRAKGIYVSYETSSGTFTKYGPSERPKKAKTKAKSSKGDKQQPQGTISYTTTKKAAPQTHSQLVACTPNALVEAAHPSWLAKQKQKEKEKISLTAFSGKKITFS